MPFLRYVLLTSALLAFTGYRAQISGGLDLSLNPSDEGFNYGDGADATINSAERLPDGRLLVCGSFVHFNGRPCPGLSLLHPDGHVDDTFTGPATSSYPRSIRAGADGGIWASWGNAWGVRKMARISGGRLPGTLNAPMDLVLFDALGRELRHAGVVPGDDRTVHIDLHGVPPGHHILILSHKGRALVQRSIIVAPSQ